MNKKFWQNATQPRALYAVLNMGLGHATRSLPLIRALHSWGWEVLIASSGRALALLQQECPWARFAFLPDYNIRYARNRWLAAKVLVQTPKVLARIFLERREVDRLVSRFQPDLILSDHRYGVWHREVPSLFLSHQLRFAVPRGFEPLAGVPAAFNRWFHRKYRLILVPDERSGGCGKLSGELSRFPSHEDRYVFVGPLSSVPRLHLRADIDVLISVSGPEPQRSVFEEIVLRQAPRLPGKKVVLLGRSERAGEKRAANGGVEILEHPSRRLAAELMNRAKLIVSRPGYSTLMELAELGKKALLVPTPGQTEQEYLARRLESQGLYLSVPQKHLDLPRQVPAAEKFPGLNWPGATGRSLERFKELIDIVGRGEERP